MLTRTEPQTLDELVTCIHEAHADAKMQASNALDRALDAGDALIKAKLRVSSGWKRFVAETCRLPYSTAALYMQLAVHRTKIDAEKKARLGVLSLRAARRLVCKKKPGREREPMPDLLAVWDRLSEQEREDGLYDIPFNDFIKVMPAPWRDHMAARIRSLHASKAADPEDPVAVFNKKIRAILFKSFNLTKLANAPDAKEETAALHRNEAIVCLEQFLLVLANNQIDLNDVVIDAPFEPKARRRAA